MRLRSSVDPLLGATEVLVARELPVLAAASVLAIAVVGLAVVILAWLAGRVGIAVPLWVEIAVVALAAAWRAIGLVRGRRLLVGELGIRADSRPPISWADVAAVSRRPGRPDVLLIWVEGGPLVAQTPISISLRGLAFDDAAALVEARFSAYQRGHQARTGGSRADPYRGSGLD